MVIGIDASRANHTQKTGVEWYAWHTIEHLKHIIPDTVRVVLYTDTPLQGDLAVLPKHWEEKVLRWPPKRLWTQIRLSMEMLMHAPDVLWIPAHVFPLIHPKKTVMTVHDIAACTFKESYSVFEAWYSTYIPKKALKKLWKIIVPSQFTKEELIEKFSPKKTDHISVLHHGYNEAYNQKDEKSGNDVAKKYGIGTEYILSVGRLEQKKNTVRMIKAFTLYKDTHKHDKIKFVLIGKPGYGYEKVREAIEKSPYKKDIYELGWVNDTDLIACMKTAKVFLFPSLYEGFGIPVLEAQASGTIVVAGKGSSLEEVGKDGAIYVDVKKETDIAKGIETALHNREKQEECRQKGFLNIQQFSWATCAKETFIALSEGKNMVS